MKININSLDETKNLAVKIAATVDVGDVICLEGDLGSGKTTFSQFFIKSLIGSDNEVLSPTFNLVHPYDLPDKIIYHFDLYRLKSAAEAEEIGLYDALDSGVSIIEWPQIINDILPDDRLLITLIHDNGNRIANIETFGNWNGRIERIL